MPYYLFNIFFYSAFFGVLCCTVQPLFAGAIKRLRTAV